MSKRLAFFLIIVAAAVGAGRARAAEPALGGRGAPTTARGIVVSVYPPFSLVLADGRSVMLDGNTEWDGAAGAAEVKPGDEIVIVGRKSVAAPTTINAGGVRVVSGRARVAPVGSGICLTYKAAAASSEGLVTEPKPGDVLREGPEAMEKDGRTELEGIVTSVADDTFLLRTDDDEVFTVRVTADTELRGFPSIAELDVGDTVKARGELEGMLLIADRVELEIDDSGGGGGGGGADFESIGLLTELLPPDRFVLSDQRTYRVDGLTIFDDPIVSYAGLVVGHYLEVKAVYEGAGGYRAVKVEFEAERGDGQGYREIDGVVAAVSATALSLSDGTLVLLTPSTVFNGDADRPEEIRPGWTTEIFALRNANGELIALDVRCEDGKPPTTGGHDFEPHEAVLVLAGGADPQTVAARYDAAVAGEVGVGSVLLTWEKEIDDDLLAELAADPEVAAVEPNFRFRDPESVRRRFVIVDRTPTRGEYTGQPAAVRHGVAKALDIADGGGAVVAVIDTGVDPCHPLLASLLAGGGLDLVDGDLSPWESLNGRDDDGDGEIDEAAGHGTFVASLVALVAPGARILPYRVLDDDGGGTAFNLALALADAIERGVDVINLSLAYHERSIVVDLLLEEAARRGIVVVAAAGNDGATTLPFPATDSHVLAVTALRADGAGLSEFANRSENALVAVTGEEIYGGLPDGEFGTWSGTSLAAPFAAGAAALVKSLDPTVSPHIIRLLLVQWGVPVTDGGWSGRSLDLGSALAAVGP